jgi:hypothetical protein
VTLLLPWRPPVAGGFICGPQNSKQLQQIDEVHPHFLVQLFGQFEAVSRTKNTLREKGHIAGGFFALNFVVALRQEAVSNQKIVQVVKFVNRDDVFSQHRRKGEWLEAFFTANKRIRTKIVQAQRVARGGRRSFHDRKK